jgi:hypothetical protein
MANLEIDFLALQNDKAEELTDKILGKIGELYLKKEIGPSEGGIYGLGTLALGPREEIRQVILTWLTREKVDG